jgi:diamine N-acetyltransferase
MIKVRGKEDELIKKKVVYMDDFGVDIKYRGKGLGKIFFGKSDVE